MVQYDAETRSIRCTCCEHEISLFASTYRNPETFLIKRDEFKEEHAQCESFDSKSRAIAERKYRAGMKREHRAAGSRVIRGCL